MFPAARSPVFTAAGNPYFGDAVPMPTEPMREPLPVAPPSTWLGREDRCRWVLENFTNGEQVKLLRTLQDKWRHYDLRAVERKEREALAPKKKDDARWP